MPSSLLCLCRPCTCTRPRVNSFSPPSVRDGLNLQGLPSRHAWLYACPVHFASAARQLLARKFLPEFRRGSHVQETRHPGPMPEQGRGRRETRLSARPLLSRGFLVLPSLEGLVAYRHLPSSNSVSSALTETLAAPLQHLFSSRPCLGKAGSSVVCFRQNTGNSHGVLSGGSSQAFRGVAPHPRPPSCRASKRPWESPLLFFRTRVPGGERDRAGAGVTAGWELCNLSNRFLWLAKLSCRQESWIPRT